MEPGSIINLLSLNCKSTLFACSVKRSASFPIFPLPAGPGALSVVDGGGMLQNERVLLPDSDALPVKGSRSPQQPADSTGTSPGGFVPESCQ